MSEVNTSKLKVQTLYVNKKEVSYPPVNPPRLFPFQNLENHHLTPVLTDPIVF
jgi:hypothetical protein